MIVVVLKNGNTKTMENTYNVFWSNNKLEIRDIKGNKYEFENKNIGGYTVWDK